MLGQWGHPPAANHRIWRQPLLRKIVQDASVHAPAFCTVLATWVKFSHYPPKNALLPFLLEWLLNCSGCGRDVHYEHLHQCLWKPDEKNSNIQG